MEEQPFDLQLFMDMYNLGEIEVAQITDSKVRTVHSWLRGDRGMRDSIIKLLKQHVGVIKPELNLEVISKDLNEVKNETKKLAENWQALVKNLISSGVLDEAFAPDVLKEKGAAVEQLDPLGNSAPLGKKKRQDK